MPDFTEEELLQIIAAGEADRVEFKESLAGDAATRIREAICAFANDLAGREKPGLVFVGVKDDRTIGTLAVTDRLLEQLANMKTDGNIVPPPSLTVEKRRLQGKEVAVITVQLSNSPPVRFKGAIHVRIGPRRGTGHIPGRKDSQRKAAIRRSPFRPSADSDRRLVRPQSDPF